MTYDVPLYSTSDAWDPSVRAVADMDGLVFPGDAVGSAWRPGRPGTLGRIAAGMGCHRPAAVCGSMPSDSMPTAWQPELRGNVRYIGLDGLTGVLTAGPEGHVQRAVEFARIEGGRPQAARAAGPAIFMPQSAANPDGGPAAP